MSAATQLQPRILHQRTHNSSLIIFLDITILKDTFPTRLRLLYSLLHPLHDLRVCVEVFAALAVDRRVASAEEVDVDRRERVRAMLLRVHETQVPQVALLVVRVRNELPAITEAAEVVHRVLMVLALRTDELYEAESAGG